jgi:transposase
MIRAGFLSDVEKRKLTVLAKNPAVKHRFARRANAILLLDRGMSCQQVADLLFIDDDSVREWMRRYETGGADGLQHDDHPGSEPKLSLEQMAELKAFVAEALPRNAIVVADWIKARFGVIYDARSSVPKLLHRLGFVYRKPQEIPLKIDEDAQRKAISRYETLLNGLPDDEVVLFSDAVHPTHITHPAGCWGPKDVVVAVHQNSGRDRLNIHGAIDLSTGMTCMYEAPQIDAASTVHFLEMIERMFPKMRKIHLFLDNARYHHSKLVQAWMKRPGRRIVLHFIPTYCPHLNPIERLWGLMHKHVTQNRCYAKFGDFIDAIMTFLRTDVPQNWSTFCDTVSDNFRVISRSNFRVLN